MRGRVRLKLAIGIAVLAVGVPAAADPVNSDLAAAKAGGGCYPTGIQPSLFDMLVLVNPEWAPLLHCMTVASTPVLVRAAVMGMHGDTTGDVPATHVRAAGNHFVMLDP